ncbi:hypothetical protein BBJ28_00002654 [Nothophytophthora sp. Chile5]|nr:hypothetical protein BBJ28_00002654 [Nothophytophthora sp. Chile5]
MDEMAAMLETYAGGLQQSFALVFERVGQSLSQSAQTMRMMNEVMEAALLQNLLLSYTYDRSSDGQEALLVTVENRSQIMLAETTLSVHLRGAGEDFFSVALASLAVGEQHELRAPLPTAEPPLAGVIQLSLISPGTQQPLSKRCSFRVLFFQQGTFEAVRRNEERASEVSVMSENVKLERVRDVLRLSPLDGVMLSDVGRYRFVQPGGQSTDAVFYLSVKRGSTAFQVVVTVAGSESNVEHLRARCQQILRELEELSDDCSVDESEERAPRSLDPEQQQHEGADDEMEQ